MSQNTNDLYESNKQFEGKSPKDFNEFSSVLPDVDFSKHDPRMKDPRRITCNYRGKKYSVKELSIDEQGEIYISALHGESFSPDNEHISDIVFWFPERWFKMPFSK